jgi:hypothetical protein
MTINKLGLALAATITSALMVWSAMLLPTIARADSFGNDVQQCGADRPCFNASYQSGNQAIFRFTGVDAGWDFYNVRYPKAGGEAQVENRSGSFTFRNVRPNRIYRISVQGCNSHFLGRSSCSPWSESSVTTR